MGKKHGTLTKAGKVKLINLLFLLENRLERLLQK